MVVLFVYNICMKLPHINLRKMKGFIYQHRLASVIVAVAILVAIGALIYGIAWSPRINLGSLDLKEKVETRVPAPLTGELVDPAVLLKRPTAVVIENHPDARPQSGYLDADIVYETLAEGGITRTMAIFHSKESDEIGPVRSARPYFVEWATEIGALFAHVGGSVDGEEMINRLGTADLNQFSNGDYFWRASDRYAPHNVYTTTAKLFQAAKARNLSTTASVQPLNFKKDAESKDRPKSQKINIDFSYNDFFVTYNYQPETNRYLRSIAGSTATDRKTGQTVSPKNIIVEFTSVAPYVNRDGAQAVRIGTTGAGSGYLFQDGKATKIVWSKASSAGRAKYTDATSGEEIHLNPGQTWIEVVPEGNDVSYE